MSTRRAFIKTVTAVSSTLFFRPGWAASPDPSRLALIIGNGAYRSVPLLNPVNDANAVSRLCAQAGFSVESRLNATRAEMMLAIERFGEAAKRAETRQVIFYYAGHGAQLDWHNYLLPVDAVVEKQEHMKQRCVDLSLLLGQLSAAKDKTFIVILDACRNNPFGSAYRPEQKGLSQFDAPVGSLIAYATSPGNVASDGDGEHGLYTENLVRELSQRGARVEDALKRVRLNVRLASHGEQIPWETTSLEDDVFLFSDGHRKLSEAELEALAEADISEWSRIKSSRKVEDWVAYLRTFPNGRFAEIAQMRLTNYSQAGTRSDRQASPGSTRLADFCSDPRARFGVDLRCDCGASDRHQGRCAGTDAYCPLGQSIFCRSLSARPRLYARGRGDYAAIRYPDRSGGTYAHDARDARRLRCGSGPHDARDARRLRCGSGRV